MSKPTILTGLRANNDLHIGNYLGALKNIVDIQRVYAGQYQINLFVPDLHSFTTPVDHSQLQSQIMHNLRLFAAAGLNLSDDDTYIYRQSRIPAHSELTVILNNFTYMGELSRMTQYKDKSAKQDNIGVGLFDYPVLMAADILLYDAKFVPVGEDQKQHIELTRDIAVRMNKMSQKYNESDVFVVPSAYGVYNQHSLEEKSEPIRIKDLADPTKKMSKSDESGKGVIYLSDTPAQARKKIMSATTDSFGEIVFDMQERPGISNLIQLLAVLRAEPIATVRNEFEGQTQYGPLKSAVADAVESFLVDFQSKLNAVSDETLLAKLEASEAAMNKVASAKIESVQSIVGLR